MILRSYKDVEIEFRKLIAQIDEMRNFTAKVGLNASDVIALIQQYAPKGQIIQGAKFQPEDIDSTRAGGEIIHYLIHRFLQKVYFGDVEFTGMVTGLPIVGGNPFKYLEIKQDPVPPDIATGAWRISNEVSDNILLIKYNDDTTAQQFGLTFISNGLTGVDWHILYGGNIGASGSKPLRIWTQDLSIMPGNLAVTVGKFLRSVDSVGKVEWADAPGGNPFKFIDIKQAASGAVTTPGTWKITNESGASSLSNDAELKFTYTGNGRSTNFSIVAGINLSTEFIFYSGNLGTTSARLASIATKDLAILPSIGAAPAAGLVLTAADASGNAVWAAPGASSGFSAMARQNSTVTLTGTFVDIPGCSINVTVSGQFYINFVVMAFHSALDLSMDYRVMHTNTVTLISTILDGRITLVRQNSDSPTKMASQQCYFNNPTTDLCTFKLQGKKDSGGTGGSSSGLDDTNIFVMKVG